MPRKKKATAKRKAAPKRKPATKAKKNKCAVSLGRAGGLATKRSKKGIFAPSYKKRAKKKK